MIDHVSLAVRNLDAARTFYAAVLGPLGYACLLTTERRVAFGKTYPELWLNLRMDCEPPADPGGHVCLRAADRTAVEAFHAAALSNGGQDAGAPGPRTALMTDYYGAFVLDPDGNKLEALTFPRVAAN